MKKNLELAAAGAASPQCVFREKNAAYAIASAVGLRQRVARGLALDAGQEARFLQAQRDGLVCGPGIDTLAAQTHGAMLVDGFVQPMEDTTSGHIGGLPGIMEALVQAVETMRHGAAVACDFSRLRPLGARVAGVPAEASGPIACMQVLARACEAWGGGSVRRGPHTAMLRVDHPDIERFIQAAGAPDLHAPGPDRLAVGVTDAFVHAVEQDAMFPLLHAAPAWFPAPQETGADGATHYVYRRVRARELWDRILRSAHAFGEPGVVYLDRLGQRNNLWYCESLAAATPCSGPALPFYGGCCRAAVDLARFVHEPRGPRASFQHAGFAKVVATGVELLDRALDVTHWPLPQQAAQAQGKRRIALGFFGLAEAVARMNLRHGSPAAADFAREVARTMRDAAYAASVKLAARLGTFPLFEPDSYLDARAFASALPADLQAAIRRHGIRNSHLLWLPPGDSEWVHAAQGVSSARLASHDLAADAQLAMLGAVAPFVDGGVGAMVGLPGSDAAVQIHDAWLQAWRLGLQACRIA